MNAAVIAVDGDVAVVRVDVVYETPVVEELQEDVWILRFDSDGRVADYEEWGVLAGQDRRDATNVNSRSPRFLFLGKLPR